MSTTQQFKYYLIAENGQYHTKDGLTSVKTPLPESPRGWDKVRKQFIRGSNSSGVFTKITTPIQFWGVSKQIIDSLYFMPNGVNFEAYCRLLIERRIDSAVNTWQYELDFDGELDFSKYKGGGGDDNQFVELVVNQKGIMELLDANADVKYEIPFDSSAVDIYNDGIVLKNRAVWSVSDGYAISNNDPDNVGLGNHVVEANVILIENTEISVRSQPREFFGTTIADVYAENRFVFEATADGNVTLTYDYSFLFDPPSGGITPIPGVIYMRSGFIKRTPASVNTTYWALEQDSNFTQQTYQLDGTFVIPVNAGDKIFFVTGVFNSVLGSTDSYWQYYGTEMRMTFNDRLPAVTYKAFKLKDFVSKMVDKVTEGTGTLNSSYLSIGSTTSDNLTYKLFNLIPQSVFITSAEAIAGQPGISLKSTWSELKQMLMSVMACDVGVAGNTVKIEPLAHFFQRDWQIASIGDVKNLQITTANEYIYNSIQVGYNDQDYDSLNAKDEVNSTQYYSLDIKRVRQVKNLLSPYRADIYGIEYLKGTRFQKDTATSKANSDLFLHVCNLPKDSGLNAYTLKRLSTVQNGGVYSPETCYNHFIRPHENLQRHTDYIKSLLNTGDGGGNASNIAKFESGLRNIDAYTSLGNYTKQSDPVYVTGVAAPPAPKKLFIPVIYEFEHEPVNNLFNTIQANPYGYINFTSEGKTYRGFILDVSIVSSDTDTYNFKLLGCPTSTT